MRRATLLLCVVLAGCASLRPTGEPSLDWDARQAGARALDDWRMTGRVAVAVGGDGGSAGVDWRQVGTTADVALTGPLGVGTLRAVLDGEGLTLEDAAGERLRGAAAEAALQARLGAAIPFGHLRYWLLGAPAPGEPYEPAGPVDADTSAFVQAGWMVGVGRLQAQADGSVLPTRLTVAREGARLRLAVSRWELAP